jgi:hypothetical protein
MAPYSTEPLKTLRRTFRLWIFLVRNRSATFRGFWRDDRGNLGDPNVAFFGTGSQGFFAKNETKLGGRGGSKNNKNIYFFKKKKKIIIIIIFIIIIFFFNFFFFFFFFTIQTLKKICFGGTFFFPPPPQA